MKTYYCDADTWNVKQGLIISIQIRDHKLKKDQKGDIETLYVGFNVAIFIKIAFSCFAASLAKNTFLIEMDWANKQ